MPLISTINPGFRGNWSFALFEIILSLVDNAGQPYIAANATQLRLWENIPESPIALMNSEFLVLESEDDALPKLGIYHIPSARHWEWREVSNVAAFNVTHPEVPFAGARTTTNDLVGPMVYPYDRTTTAGHRLGGDPPPIPFIPPGSNSPRL